MHVTLGHAAVVINIFRKLCMQLLKADASVKNSLVAKRQRCAWSFPYALAVVKKWAFSQAIALGKLGKALGKLFFEKH